jgi:hypothetical protein
MAAFASTEVEGTKADAAEDNLEAVRTMDAKADAKAEKAEAKADRAEVKIIAATRPRAVPPSSQKTRRNPS